MQDEHATSHIRTCSRLTRPPENVTAQATTSPTRQLEQKVDESRNTFWWPSYVRGLEQVCRRGNETRQRPNVLSRGTDIFPTENWPEREVGTILRQWCRNKKQNVLNVLTGLQPRRLWRIPWPRLWRQETVHLQATNLLNLLWTLSKHVNRERPSRCVEASIKLEKQWYICFQKSLRMVLHWTKHMSIEQCNREVESPSLQRRRCF